MATLSRDEIYAKVKDVLVDALGVDEEEVKPDAVIKDDLGAESIDFLDISFRLEKAFGFKIAKGELMPEMQNDPNLVKEGLVTPAGIALLREKLPTSDIATFEKDPKLENMSRLFTVNTLVDFVQQKLAQTQPAEEFFDLERSAVIDKRHRLVSLPGDQLFMRWIWIDKFTEFTSKQSASAVKNVSLAEEHLHDLFPAFPIVPHSLIVEGMAQTAGILVGEARNFAEKVILAKIGRATFHRLVRPGETIVFCTRIDQLSEQGASTSGTVKVGDDLVAEIDIMFSHIDQNLAGMEFPEHNFVFTEQFTELLKTYRLSAAVAL